MFPCCIVFRPVKLFFYTLFLLGRAVEALQYDIVMNPWRVYHLQSNPVPSTKLSPLNR